VTKGDSVSEDQRTEEQNQHGEEEVEAHGVKEVAGVGLAAAALIGAGAVGVKVARDDDKSRDQAALVAPEDARERLAKADADGDGYVNYRELANVDMKFNVTPLQAEGTDVTAEALASAGVKIEIPDVGGEDGYELEGNAILLKYKVDEEVDRLVQGSGLEWFKKHKEIDRDGDGYASYEELSEVGWEWDPSELNEAGYEEVSAEELAKAGWKQPLATFGEGGFVTKEGMIMLRFGVDDKLDALAKEPRPAR
jgi:Ca2+-binding EF-hand superfamily protein